MIIYRTTKCSYINIPCKYYEYPSLIRVMANETTRFQNFGLVTPLVTTQINQSGQIDNDLSLTGGRYVSAADTCVVVVCWSLTSLCHSNGHIETMPAREINPFTALTRFWSQFLRTQWSTSNHSEWTRLRIRPLSHRGWRRYLRTPDPV